MISKIVIVCVGAGLVYVAYRMLSNISAHLSDLDAKMLTSSKLEALDTIKFTQDLNRLEGLIAEEKRNSAIGGVFAFCGSTLPDNYMFCDGSTLLISDYADLFVVLGTSFNQSATDSTLYFNLPDLRNQFVRGFDPSNSTRVLGSVEMYKTALPRTRALVSDVSGNHMHTLDSAGGHTHSMTFNTAAQSGSSTQCLSVPNYQGQVTQTTNKAGDHTHTMDMQGAHSHKIVSGGDDETSPTNVALNYIIRVK